MDTLPLDVIVTILRYLDEASLEATELTCHKLKGAIHSANIWKEHCLSLGSKSIIIENYVVSCNNSVHDDNVQNTSNWKHFYKRLLTELPLSKECKVDHGRYFTTIEDQVRWMKVYSDTVREVMREGSLSHIVKYMTYEKPHTGVTTGINAKAYSLLQTPILITPSC